MNLKDLCETFDFKITGGSEYTWNCYGPNARYLDFNNDKADCSVIFDSITQLVYQAEVWIKDSEHRPYRWVNSDFTVKLSDEAKSRGIDNTIAFDSVTFVDLEVDEDFLEKAKAIWNGLPFDERVQVPIDEDVWLDLAKEAHKRDITINQLTELILNEEINRHKEKHNV